MVSGYFGLSIRLQTGSYINSTHLFLRTVSCCYCCSHSCYFAPFYKKADDFQNEINILFDLFPHTLKKESVSGWFVFSLFFVILPEHFISYITYKPGMHTHSILFFPFLTTVHTYYGHF